MPMYTHSLLPNVPAVSSRLNLTFFVMPCRNVCSYVKLNHHVGLNYSKIGIRSCVSEYGL